MFTDIKSIRKQLLYVQGASNISVTKQRVLTLSGYEMSIILSFMYRYTGKTPPIPRREVEKTNKDSWDVIFGMLVYHCEEDSTNFNQYYLTLSYDWQVALYAILSKRILNTVGEHIFFDAIETLYTKENLMGMVTLPNIIPNNIGTQFIKKKINKVSFPVEVYRVGKHVKISKLKYLVNYGIKTITNTRRASSKKEILSGEGIGRVGVIFTEHKAKGYKYRTNVYPLFKGRIDSILALYKGDYYDSKHITPLSSMKYVNTILDKEELNTFIKENYKKNFLLLSKEGLCSITPLDEYVTLPCIDYILDAEYNAIGVKVLHNEKPYNIYFNVKDTQLNSGIIGRFIRCSVRTIEGVIVQIKFNSVVKKWHNLYPCCLYCKTIRTKHMKKGICNSCVRKFEKNIQTGSICTTLYSGNDFSLPITVEGSTYKVIGKDGALRYELVNGQGRLSLY